MTAPLVLAREELAALDWATYVDILARDVEPADEDATRGVGFTSLLLRRLVGPSGDGFAYVSVLADFEALTRHGRRAGRMVTSEDVHGVHAWTAWSSNDHYAVLQTLGGGYTALAMCDAAGLESLIRSVLETVDESTDPLGGVLVEAPDGEPSARYTSTGDPAQFEVRMSMDWVPYYPMDRANVVREVVERWFSGQSARDVQAAGLATSALSPQTTTAETES